MVKFTYYIQEKYQTIALAEGEVREFNEGGPTEEGWHYTNYQFVHLGDRIQLQISNASRDCDGDMDSYRELECPLDKLDAYVTPDGVSTPDWNKVEDHQRDYTAEAAGY